MIKRTNKMSCEKNEPILVQFLQLQNFDSG